MTTAELSKVLFAPTAILLYFGAMLGYLWSMSQRVDRPDVSDGTAAVAAGRKTLWIGTGLAVLGLAAHLGHLITNVLVVGE